MRVDLSIPHGATLGRYELLAPIGTGGMATVILARQRGPRGFEKAVVLKVVHPHLAHDKAAIDMLLDEARVAAQISHHNVVQTYELGEAGGTYFIAMEYLAGESLSHVLKAATTGAPAPSPVLGARIVADVAEGLHAAHELRGFDGAPLGVIHRDVSPSNVVVLYNGGVKVVDFGIAKAHGRVTSTQNGRVKGKYGYMSPEQIHDDGVDRRADVFSLGVVLWETLALRRLFREDNIVATLHQILTAERLPPSHYRPDVPPALDAVALRALAVDPARRYATAAEMKAAIDDAIWQARCGAGDIQAYMTDLFADRIAERQQILARVAHAAPRLTRREIEVIGAAFDDTSSLQMAKAPREQTRATAGLGPVRVPIVAPVAGADTFFIPATRVSRRPSVLSWRAKVVAVLGASLGLAIAAAVGARGRLPAAPPADLAVAALEQPGAAGGLPAETPAPQDPTTTADQVRPSLDVATPTTKLTKTDPNATAKTNAAVAPNDDPQPGTEAFAGRTGRGPRVPKKPEHVGPGAGPSADELTALGTQHFLAGDVRTAERDFRAALAADRRNAAAHRGLGLICQRAGRDGEAVAHFRRYLELAPTAHDAAAIRARIEALEAAFVIRAVVVAVAGAAITLAAVAAPAAAGPTRVFPLAGVVRGDRAGAPAAMTAALAHALDAEVAAVALDDAAAVLGCDAGDAACLDAIARSIGATDLVFGTVTAAAGGARVVLARHTIGAAPRRATFTVDGAAADALASALVAAAGEFLGIAPEASVGEAADADPQPVAIGGPVVSARPPPRRTPRYVWGVIAGGAVVAAIGGGFLISARGLRDDVTTAPTSSRDDIDKLIELEDTGRSRSRLGGALVVAGGLAIATGVVLAIVHRRHRADERATPTRTVELAPALVPGGAMVVLRIGAP